MRWRATALGVALLLVGCTGVGGQGVTVDDPAAPVGTLTVSAASSLTDVMPRLIADFEQRHPQASVTPNFAGSSTLVEQVLGGAQVDVIATASLTTMDKAVDGGVVAEPRVFAGNSMALVVPTGNPAGLRSLRDLQRSDLLVGLCEVSVPCGAAAAQLLDAADVVVTPVTQELEVRALLGKVIAGELDAGLVYVTDAKSAGQQVEVVAVPEEVNPITQYPVAVVRHTPNEALARAFVDYLATDSTAQAILRDFGFRAAPSPAASAS